MAKLTCLNSVSQWEINQVSMYPEIRMYIEKLKKLIGKKPDGGLLDAQLSVTGKIIPCRKQSVNISLFSNEYAFGYNFITASYVFNNDNILIIKMAFS